MLNNVVMVGRLANELELKETEMGKYFCNITLAVPRSYKNEDGVYDTDFLDCVIWDSVAKNTCEYCKQGDMVGVKGRLQSRFINKEDGTKVKKIDVVGEKITFLAQARDKENNKENNMERN